jgi:hypothetical protein
MKEGKEEQKQGKIPNIMFIRALIPFTNVVSGTNCLLKAHFLSVHWQLSFTMSVVAAV